MATQNKSTLEDNKIHNNNYNNINNNNNNYNNIDNNNNNNMADSASS